NVTLGNSVLSLGDISAINAMVDAGYLDTERDKSGEPILRVQTLGGAEKVAKGDFKRIVVPSNRFWWYSGEAREWTTAPPGTNVITVYRKREGRDILWFCFQEPDVTVPTRHFLGDEHDMCGEPSLLVFGVSGAVSVGRGDTVEVRISNRHFQWRCGGSNE